MEIRILSRFKDALRAALKKSVKKAHIMGAGFGFSLFFMFGVYALTFWYGNKLVNQKKIQPGDLLTVFFAVVIGAMGIGQAGQLSPDMAKAKGAAANIFAVIDRTPEINRNIGGDFLTSPKGSVRFKDVCFSYPNRPEVPVLRDFNLKVRSGTTIALVGHSGSGKSTIVQLLERFYDPQSGVIMVDGVDIRTLDLVKIREQIALVSQEPTLFQGSIEYNILQGNPDATHDQVVDAAKTANAYDFIIGLSEGFDTEVGEKGIQLSGGQKQRIAIARAVLKDPKILLLDEATSALDTESEKLVQDALEKLMRNRTCIVIAHRLTTVRDAHKIYVLSKGKMVEAGTHQELLEKNGFYAHLVSRQLNEQELEEISSRS